MSIQIENNKHLKLVEDLLLVFILVFSVQFLNQWWHIKFLLITVLIVGHFTRYRSKFSLVFWGLTLVLVSLDFIENYFYVANHSFVLFYCTLLIVLSYFYPQARIKILCINSKIMIAMMMFFGAVQKMLSPEFMNGNFIAFTTAKGEFFKSFLWMFNASEMGNQNTQMINEKLNSIPDSTLQLQLVLPFEGFATFSYYFSIAVVVAEFLIIPVLFLKNSQIKNAILLLFLIGLLLTRFETGFMALISILLIAQLDPSDKTFKLFYLGLFAACLALILSRLGLY